MKMRLTVFHFEQVVNLDDCLSINHNWINSCNIGDATAQVPCVL